MRFATVSRLFAVVAMMAMLVPGLLLAQNSTTGAINGTVTDPSNAVISSAAVTLTNLGTGVSVNATTNSSGSYGFPLLGPSTYKLTVKQTGFRTVEQTVTVAVGQTTTANVQLLVGQSAEVVEVTGAVPMIQTEDANISTTFTAKQVDRRK